MMPLKPPSCIHRLRYTLILLFALLISGCTTTGAEHSLGGAALVAPLVVELMTAPSP